jgi:gluconolactonase
LAVDSEGNVCVATLVTGGITVVTESGDVKAVVIVPGSDPLITNVCFGGPNLQTAYITASGTGALHATEWFCPGFALPFSS